MSLPQPEPECDCVFTVRASQSVRISTRLLLNSSVFSVFPQSLRFSELVCVVSLMLLAVVSVSQAFQYCVTFTSRLKRKYFYIWNQITTKVFFSQQNTCSKIQPIRMMYLYLPVRKSESFLSCTKQHVYLYLNKVEDSQWHVQLSVHTYISACGSLIFHSLIEQCCESPLSPRCITV